MGREDGPHVCCCIWSFEEPGWEKRTFVGTQAAIYVLSIFEGFNSVFAARVLLMSFSGSVLMISFFFPLHGRELNCNVTDVRKPKFEISFTTDKIVQKGNGIGKLYVSSPRPTGRKRHLGSGSRTRQLAVGSAVRYGSGCAPRRPRDLGQAPPCVRASNLLRWEHGREQHCILRGSFRGGIGEIQFGNSWQGIWNVFTFYK